MQNGEQLKSYSFIMTGIMKKKHLFLHVNHYERCVKSITLTLNL